jgi:hypothetical protein
VKRAEERMNIVDAYHDLGSAADQPDSPRNVRPEQAKSDIECEDGVYLCAEGSLELRRLALPA